MKSFARMQVKKGIMRDGVPFCPHCLMPIESELVDKGVCRCVWCAGLVTCMSSKELIEMLRHADRDMIREWDIEVMSYA